MCAKNRFAVGLTAMGRHYEIVSIRRADPPPGAKGCRWHEYVIAFEGNNTIQGYLPGNLPAVTRAVEEFVAQLNKRHLAKRGRVQLV